MSRHVLADRNAALTLGLLAWGVGAWLLWDAFENRGVKRPTAMRALGIFGG